MSWTLFFSTVFFHSMDGRRNRRAVGANRLSPSRVLILCIVVVLAHGARLRSSTGRSTKRVALVHAGAKKDPSATTVRLRHAASPELLPVPEDEDVGKTLLDAALSKIDGWVEMSRQADETGALGMPPPGSSIVIDGPSVAWAHSEHKKFSTAGLRHVVQFFLDRGYPSVVAFVSQTYSQEPPKDSARTRVADDIDLLKDLQDAGHVQLIPPGASEEAMLLQYAWSQQAFVVSNNDFAEFKLECSSEEEEWVRTHHIYFSWHEGLFLPNCERDHRVSRGSWVSKRDRNDGHGDDLTAGATQEKLEEEAMGLRVMEAVPPFAWIPAGGNGVLRALPTIAFLALVQSKGWNKIDEDSLEALVALTTDANARAGLHAARHAGAPTEDAGDWGGGEGAARGEGPEVVVIEGRLGVISSVDFEGIEIDAGTAPPAAYPTTAANAGGEQSGGSTLQKAGGQGGDGEKLGGSEGAGEKGDETEERSAADKGGGATAGASTGAVEQILESWGRLQVRASSGLLAPDTIRHGDTVEFDAVYDTVNGLWRATRLVRTGMCVAGRQSDWLSGR